jgi:hypothetical protein
LKIIFYFLVFEPQWALGALETHDNKDIGGDWKGPTFFSFGATWGAKLKRTLRLNVNKSPRDIRGARKDNV